MAHQIAGRGLGQLGMPGGATSPSRDVPVFTFPNALNFYADDKDSLRQILTVYNPYEFPIKFRVYSTAPKLYSVMDAQGTVKPGFCSDIVIRRNSSGQQRYGQVEKFRIQVYDSLNNSLSDQAFGPLLGRKTIEAVLHEKKPVGPGAYASLLDTDDESEFTRLASSTADPGSAHSRNTSATVQWQPRRTVTTFSHTGQFSAPSPLILLVAVVCITVLCLPTENTVNSQLPHYLHLTINQKLVAAYILGLITMVILRT